VLGIIYFQLSTYTFTSYDHHLAQVILELDLLYVSILLFFTGSPMDVILFFKETLDVILETWLIYYVLRLIMVSFMVIWFPYIFHNCCKFCL